MNDNLAQHYTFFVPILELNHIFKRHIISMPYHENKLYTPKLFSMQHGLLKDYIDTFLHANSISGRPLIFLWRQISLRVWLARHRNLQSSFWHHLLQNVHSPYHSSHNRQGIYYFYKKTFDNHFKAVNIQKNQLDKKSEKNFFIVKIR